MLIAFDGDDLLKHMSTPMLRRYMRTTSAWFKPIRGAFASDQGYENWKNKNGPIAEFRKRISHELHRRGET